MESVERHLGGRLADGLRGHGPHHLAGRGHRQVELRLDLAEQPLERLLGEPAKKQEKDG